MKKLNTDQKRKLISERFKKSGNLRFKEIKVAMGTFLNLGYCHINARQSLEVGNTNTIAQVIYLLPKGLLRLHWIEKHGKGYIDNTLGYLSKDMTYFLTKEYTLNDLKDKPMHEINDKAKRTFLASLFTPKELKSLKFDLTDV